MKNRKLVKSRAETSLLDDFAVNYRLEWPSLTVEWLPNKVQPKEKDYTVQQMIVGTCTSGNEPNYLLIAQVKLFHNIDRNSVRRYGDGLNNFGSAHKEIKIIQEINHDGEVNRARYMPQNPYVIATRSSGSEIYIFDYRLHPARPRLDGRCKPNLTLRGHTSEGFGLSWNRSYQGHLLSGSDDARICLWDLNINPTNQSLDAIYAFKVHEGVVEDVAWHIKHPYLFGSTGEDKHLIICDLRTPAAVNPAQSVVAHTREVNSLAFNPLNEWLVATGSSDETVKLFDLRKIKKELHSLQCHNEVFQVGWNPKKKTVLASCCSDKTLKLWDTGRIGEEETQEGRRGDTSRLLLTHGHTNKIGEFSWNPCEDWTVASVDEDNNLEVWRVPENIQHY